MCIKVEITKNAAQILYGLDIYLSNPDKYPTLDKLFKLWFEYKQQVSDLMIRLTDSTNNYKNFMQWGASGEFLFGNNIVAQYEPLNNLISKYKTFSLGTKSEKTTHIRIEKDDTNNNHMMFNISGATHEIIWINHWSSSIMSSYDSDKNTKLSENQVMVIKELLGWKMYLNYVNELNKPN